MADKKGYEEAIEATRAVLRAFGVWPNRHKISENWLSRSHFLAPAFLIICFINIPQTLKIIKVWRNLNEVLDILVTANIPSFVALIKLLCVRYNKKVIGLLLVSMENDWKSLKTLVETRIMWKNGKLGSLITLVIYTLTCGSYVAYVIMITYINVGGSKQEDVITLNESKKLRPLYMRSYFIYDVQKTPVYEIIWIFQFVSMGVATFTFMAVDSLFAVLMMHLCGQLINLQERLKNFTNMLGQTKTRNFSYQLSTIVSRHEQLNRFAKAIENAFNTMFLVQMLLSGMVLCLQGYQIVIILTGRDTVQIIELLFMVYYTLCFAFSLFVYCYIAEILRIESMEIGNAAYHCDWYDLSAFERRLFILTIIRSKTPFEITAGKFAAFSLEFYCSILKTSGGYLSVLLAVQDRLAA
ncbi:odorant receptor 12 [Nasonia vitripennis]|uniref:Odorant receptor n=1 Tax=Nasonia vitripennis TaxID=7425 RepID=A0A7M6UVS1_NASVI|nr:odorant receptor 12 [Nasonia vitripennis]